MIPKLSIGDITARVPIIQGGMGIGVSLAGLASAVANAGGIGVIATAGVGNKEPDYCSDHEAANSRGLIKQIREAREKTDGILGVNIMVAVTNYADLVKTAVKEKVDIIFSGAGLPFELPALVKDSLGPKLVPIVSSARAARIICKKWLKKYDRLPDAFVVEGPMAGGHLGFKPDEIDKEEFALENLIPQVVETVKAFEKETGKRIPVIAAGGVYTGQDIRKFIEMGAAGVQMGTRFVATEECDAADSFKQAYVKASEDDVQIIKSPVGLPGRALRNSFLKKVDEGRRKPKHCPFHCLHHCDPNNSDFCISAALVKAQRGNTNEGLVFAGKNVTRVKSIVKVDDLIGSLVKEYDEERA